MEIEWCLQRLVCPGPLSSALQYIAIARPKNLERSAKNYVQYPNGKPRGGQGSGTIWPKADALTDGVQEELFKMRFPVFTKDERVAHGFPKLATRV